jgi:hypothetical protein
VFRSGLIMLSLVLAFAAAGCGGGDDGGGSGGNGNQTPGQTLLADAGLQTCTHDQSTAAAWYGTGFVQGVSSEVAPDCSNAPAVPTTVYGLTYKDNDTADTAAKSIRKTHPKDQVIQPTVAPYTTTVLVVEGPKSEEYAKSIEAALPTG